MTNLQITGKQKFMGVEIPVVLGGFGENKKAISDKTIAEIHGQPEREIRKSIGRNIARFHENVDFIDFKKGGDKITTYDILQQLGYSKQQITQAEHIYILSERGYAKLIKIFDTDLAWEIHDNLIDEYFTLREENKTKYSLNLQILMNMEEEQNKIKESVEKMSHQINTMGDVVSLNTDNWRKDASKLINQIALSWGGYKYIREINNQIYEQLDVRMGVNIRRRQENMKQRMLETGISESKVKVVSVVDAISVDRKLIEGYIAIVKESAIKNGIHLK